MPTIFTIHKTNGQEGINPILVSSVALIAMDNSGKILVTRHKSRGWDIPGGHVEMNETIEEALVREVQEEAGATFEHAVLIATITSDTTDEKNKGKSMLIFTTHDFTLLDEWVPSDDVSDRAVMDLDKMLADYNGDHDGMRELVAIAVDRLNGTV